MSHHNRKLRNTWSNFGPHVLRFHGLSEADVEPIDDENPEAEVSEEVAKIEEETIFGPRNILIFALVGGILLFFLIRRR